MRATTVLALVGMTMLAGCLSGGPLTGDPAPKFEFVTSDGTFVNETTYLGRYVILDLMATWCGPCKLEVAHLREVQETFGDRVVILSIGTDPQETMADMEAFSEEYGATWPYALDRDGKVKAAMQMRIIPKLVILDPEGVVVFEQQGEVGVAAISRVIDPTLAPDASRTTLAVLAALGAGFLAAFNPYRRLHRDGIGAGPTLAALGIFVALGAVAYSFLGLASTRATYGSLFIGALSLAAVAWWARARRKVKDQPPQGSDLQRASDRAYEMAPHFVGALVLGLGAVGSVGFFAPIAGFLAGASGGLLARPRIAARHHDALGLAGLALVGLGLLLFGARILLAEA